MVPRLCRYKWHSSGLKARILGEVFYCLFSKLSVCHLAHKAPSTVCTLAKKRRVAAELSCRRRPPFLKLCKGLRAWWCTQTTCESPGMRVDTAATLRHVRKVAPTAEETRGSMMESGWQIIQLTWLSCDRRTERVEYDVDDGCKHIYGVKNYTNYSGIVMTFWHINCKGEGRHYLRLQNFIHKY